MSERVGGRGSPIPPALEQMPELAQREILGSLSFVEIVQLGATNRRLTDVVGRVLSHSILASPVLRELAKRDDSRFGARYKNYRRAIDAIPANATLAEAWKARLDAVKALRGDGEDADSLLEVADTPEECIAVSRLAGDLLSNPLGDWMGRIEGEVDVPVGWVGYLRTLFDSGVSIDDQGGELVEAGLLEMLRDKVRDNPANDRPVSQLLQVFIDHGLVVPAEQVALFSELPEGPDTRRVAASI